MKITYLGTGAYDSIPAAFCRCENCEKARRLGGRNIRSHLQALINDDLMIDLSPETHFRANVLGVSLVEIKNFLITHTHEDHFYPTLISNLHPNFSDLNEGEVFHFFGSKDLNDFSDCYNGARAQIHVLSPFEKASVGRYEVTPLKATHPTENPFLYIISDGEKTILYAHDTGLFCEENFDYIRREGVKFDFISLDCTKGDLEDLNYPNHQCLGRNILTRERLKEIGAVDGNTKIVLGHFSHKGVRTCYDDFSPIAHKHGFLASYDGMSVEV